MKIKRFAALICTIVILCGGCSYQKIDNQIQDIINGPTNEQDVVEVPPLSEDQIEYKGIGETFSAYKKYAVDVGDGSPFENEKGNEGLTYTLKGVAAYTSIYDADVDMYGCMFADNDDLIKNNAFILIDIQASYTAPAEGEKQIIADAGELSGEALESKMTQQNADGLWPTLAYFSMRPKEDDPLLNYQHQMFCYIIQDGETISFQVGLICAQDYIDDKNVFLEVNAIPSTNWLYEMTGDTARKLFVLFPGGEE